MKHFKFLIVFLSCNLNASNAVMTANYSIPIAQPQINGSTFTISTSGYYLLSESVQTSSTTASHKIIQISANDVTLDLNSYSISSDNGANGIVAISVDSDLSNITIKNGTIFQVTGYGIEVGNNCSNVEISNMYFKDCDAGGVLLTGTISGEVNNCRITQSEGAASSTSAVGLTLDTCTNINVLNSEFTSNNSITIPSKGLFADTCTNCSLSNCLSVANTGTSGYGYHFSGCSACKLNECSATNNSGLSGESFGFAFDSCNSTQVLCCKALANTSSTNHSYGFYFSDSNYNLVTQCEGTGQTADIDAHGFYSSNGEGNQFLDCKASGNVGGDDSTDIGSGFTFVSTETRSTIINCQSLSNGTNAGEGYGIKFALSGDSVSNCVVRNCQLTSNFGTKKYGFKDFSTSMSSFLANNVAYGQGKIFPLSSGAIVDNGTKNFMFTFTDSGQSAGNMITETDISTLTTLDTAAPYNNISIYN